LASHWRGDASTVIVVLMGVAGAGKTTVGKRLAEALGWAFLEGDALHPPCNIEKMRRGIPLTDDDRAAWLARLREHIAAYLAAAQPAVIACSALRHAYRACLRVSPRVHFVYLKGTYALHQERLTRRTDHFMKAAMLPSQWAALEPPQDALVVDAALPVDDIVRQLRAALAVARNGAPDLSPNNSSSRADDQTTSRLR
jgi:gluconokinase